MIKILFDFISGTQTSQEPIKVIRRSLNKVSGESPFYNANYLGTVASSSLSNILVYNFILLILNCSKTLDDWCIYNYIDKVQFSCFTYS